jgi:hypothetical protein
MRGRILRAKPTPFRVLGRGALLSQRRRVNWTSVRAVQLARGVLVDHHNPLRAGAGADGNLANMPPYKWHGRLRVRG